MCPYYLVDYCPHLLFTNTKADLGACPKLHDDKIKKEFADIKETHPKKIGYTQDMLKLAHRLVGDLGSKIR